LSVTWDRSLIGTTVSSTNKTDRHDVTEILLKVALFTLNQYSNTFDFERTGWRLFWASPDEGYSTKASCALNLISTFYQKRPFNSKVCQRLVASRWYSDFSTGNWSNWPPRCNWNIVESGVKLHNPKHPKSINGLCERPDGTN
jgi:hypothetical protein